MAKVPAFCNMCGFAFDTGLNLGSNSSIINCATECPKCGNTVDLDAHTDSRGNLFLFSKTAFRVLTSSAVPEQKLYKFKELVKSSHQQKTDKSEFIETIKQELPELDEITNLLVPTNAGEFYSLLALLLALITFIMLVGDSNEPSPTIINNFYNSSEPETAACNAAYAQSGIKRKSPCPCGSGKKFKNCHGI